MTRTLCLLLLTAAIGSCATSPQRNVDLVNRALDAMGGADSYAKVKTIAVKGNWKQWEPDQSFAPGGEMRHHANDATFEAVADYGTRSIRVDWVKDFAYPAPRTFKFSEIVTPDAGYVIGREANALNKQSADLKSPAHSMSGLRLTATQRELRRASPLLLLGMRNNPDRLSGSPDIAIGGISYPAVNYNAGAYTYTVLFDPQTGLPARVRTFEYDNVWGDVTYDLAPYTRNPDLAARRDLSGTPILEVADKHVFNDGKREVSVHLIENPHASALLLAYVADARIAYVTDVYSPGAPLPPKMNPALQSVVNGVKKAGIQPVTFVGGHGSSAPYSLLVGLAGN
jgi:hypothetical protein